MIQTGLWQERAIEQLTALLYSDESIRALILTGSCVQGRETVDPWSDVDLVIVASEGAVQRYFASTDWLAPLGQVFATDRSSKESWLTLRVCLKDMRRMDFGITTEFALQHPDGLIRRLTRANCRVLFSRSTIVDALLDQETMPASSPLFAPEQFRILVNQFWFKGTLAVTKVARNDLLIGLHLALDMDRDCCVLAMVLRDRSVGTDHHRRGGAYNEVIQAMDASRYSYTSAGILDMIEQSSIMFEHLAREWLADYTEQRQPLIEWIAYTRQTLTEGVD